MKVLDIFDNLHTRTSVQPLLVEQIEALNINCSQFILESNRMPVYKHINKQCTFTKLKARVKKKNDRFSESFNSAFAPKLRQRAIYVHGALTESINSSYFIFPINGYRYVFNTQITDSSIYETVYNNIYSDEIFTDLLHHNYTDSNLTEGIASGAEILFHNIPYCYAVNSSAFDSYNELLSII